MVFWITGLTASGKTTLGCLLKKKLIKHGFTSILHLDGDELRKRNKFRKGHSIRDRWYNLKLIVKTVSEEIDENQIIIVSTVSHLLKMRLYARKNIKNFHEIYLDCSPEACAQRDYKNIYKKFYNNFISNNEIFPGVTEPYQKSISPELIIDTNNESIDNSIIKLLNYSLKSIKKELRLK